MSFLKSFGTILKTASHLHTGSTIVSKLLNEINDSNDLKVPTRQIEINFASMISRLPDKNLEDMTSFLGELQKNEGLKYILMLRFFGIWHEVESATAFKELIKISEIYANASQSEKHEKTLSYCEVNGYSKFPNSSGKLLIMRVQELFRELQFSKKTKGEINDSLDSFEKSFDDFLGKRYGDKTRVKWDKNGNLIKK